MQGIIYKGIGSFYTVHTENGEEYVCKARGRFRKDGITPVVGDVVEFEAEETGHCFMTKIHARRNMLIRPAVANIDKLIIVMSASVPKPDLYLTDKLIAACEAVQITPVLVINKCDADDNDADGILNDYVPTGYKILKVSAVSGEGLDALRAELKGSISCLAGQSAVGKSSILNALIPGLMLPTGELSQKTDRGKHTTRHAQLWELDGGGAVFDTPGFSLLESVEVAPEDLGKLYVEFKNKQGECRFSGCAHINEPDCAVKDLLRQGKLSLSRYERYKCMYAEISEQYKHRYDRTKFIKERETKND